MTFQTTNAAVLAGGLPDWAAALIMIAVFIAAAVISGLVSYKLRKKQLRKQYKDDKGDKYVQ